MSHLIHLKSNRKTNDTKEDNTLEEQSNSLEKKYLTDPSGSAAFKKVQHLSEDFSLSNFEDDDDDSGFCCPCCLTR